MQLHRVRESVTQEGVAIVLTKSAPVLIKNLVTDGAELGQFEAIVSVFGNVDSYGDKVIPGAFTDTLADWREKGATIPLYWSHRMDDPDFNIGGILDAREVTEDELGYKHPPGLWVKGQLDVDPDDGNPKAVKVYKMMKGGRVREFSFAYDVDAAGWASDEVDGEFFELRKLKLHEVSSTQVGANPATELLGVKSLARVAQARVKAGRVLSAKNEESLRAARDAIDAVLKAVESEDSGNNEDDEKAKQTPPAKAEDPDTGKAEEPTGTSSAASLLTVISVLEREGADQ